MRSVKKHPSKNLDWLLCPFYETEITLCDNLVIFLESFLSLDNKNNVTLGADASKIENAFEGMVIKKRDEDVLFADDILKLPLATIENLLDIKVIVPTKISEIPNTIQKSAKNTLSKSNHK
ncbi:unnamed protein product [Rhizopus stolonifer]